MPISSSVEQLQQLISDIPVAMLTTIAKDGAIHTRPMAHQQLDDDGNLWFFTADASPKSAELEENEQVNVSYLDNGKGIYVSISGDAFQLRDMQKAKELWSPAVKAWFPEGLNDPALALIRVRVKSAQYWEQTAGFVMRMVEMAKAVVTGKVPDIADNKTLQVHAH